MAHWILQPCFLFCFREKKPRPHSGDHENLMNVVSVHARVCVCVCARACVRFKAPATSVSRSLQAHKLREATQPELTGCWTVPSCCRFIFPVASVCACSVTSVVSGSLKPLLERCSDSSSLRQGSFCFASAQLQPVY